MRMILQELENLQKNDPVAFTLWLNEAKNMPTKEGDIARAVIQNSIAKKAVVKGTSMSKAGGGGGGGATSSSSSSTNNNRTCICSPTSHAGSFKCKFHRMTSSHKWLSSTSSFNIAQQHDENKRDVRTGSADSQPRLSRFARAACDDMPLSMPEKVK